METIRNIPIRELPIELYKLLKLANLVNSGGEGKAMIAEGLVKVNDQLETRKRRKILINDIIEVQGEKIQVVLDRP